MKFIQVSDLHLERPFEGIYQEQNQFFPHLEYLNETVFSNIIDMAIEKDVDFVLFCGDTFHQSQISLKTQDYFLKGMRTLKDANIQVVLTFGNHDYYTPSKFWFEFPDNVILFTSEKVEEKLLTLPKSNEKVNIVGFSYEHRWLAENKLDEFPKKGQEVTIGIYHGSEKIGSSRQDKYAPFDLLKMRSMQYDYFALGHIHVPGILSFEPPIVYGGTPQGHSTKETKVRGVVYVELNPEKSAKFDFVPVERLTYTRESLSLMEINPENYLTKIEEFIQGKLTPLYQIFSLEIMVPKEMDVDKEDLLSYLRSWSENENLSIYLNKLDVNTEGQDKISLPLPPSTLDNYQKLYQGEVFFKKELADFYQVKELKALMEGENFQEEVVEKAVKILKDALFFEEDDHEDN